MKTKTAKPAAPAEPTWEHRGHTITLTTAGAFQAKVNARHIAGPSLDAIKKKIDGFFKFEAFTAIDLTFHPNIYKSANPKNPAIRQVAVIGVTAKGGRGHGIMFVGEATPKPIYGGRGGEYAVLYPDTPECRTAYTTYMDVCVENQKLKRLMDHAEAELRVKIPHIKAASFINAGNKIVVEFHDPPMRLRLDDDD